MGVEKIVVLAIEAVAALHVCPGPVETGSEAVELRLNVRTTFIQEPQSWSLASKFNLNVSSIDCHVHDVSAFFCKSRAALTEPLQLCAWADMPSSNTCVIASCQRYLDMMVSNREGSQSHSDHCDVDESKARTT